MDRTSTPAVGVMRTSSFGSLANARPITTFCWLPPDRSETGTCGPAALIVRSAMVSRARASRRAGEMRPRRPTRSGTVIVTFSAMDSSGTRPSRCRSCGTSPTPASRASGTLPGRSTRPSTLTVPPAGRVRPTIASAASTLPLPPPPAMPTTSPALACSDSSAPEEVTRSRTDSSTGASAGSGRWSASGMVTSSPVIAATNAGRLSCATGAVTMCRASRKTVTWSQIS